MDISINFVLVFNTITTTMTNTTTTIGAFSIICVISVGQVIPSNISLVIDDMRELWSVFNTDFSITTTSIFTINILSMINPIITACQSKTQQ
jgi:hypothetical protein